MSEAVKLIEELAALSKRPDFLGGGKAIGESLHLAKKLGLALQKPEDAAIELCFQPIFAAAARVAIDLKLFHLIADSTSGITATKLAEASGCSETLLVRLLRPLAALHFVYEVKENAWAPTTITRAMCIPPIEAAHIHFWDQGTTAAIKMPSFFKETGYRQPEDPRNGLFQYGIGTDKEAFEYWSTMPDVVDNFNTCMTGIRGSRPSWIEWFPVRERILGLELTSAGSDVLLVDIAGGRGHDVQAFGRKFEDVQGRLVLQDLPAVIGDIQHLDDRVERLEYDFFTEQPIKGARVYFFHFIMHDWSDEVCVGILSRTAAVMKPGYSKLLLNEFILPDQGCPLFPAGFDLQMMAMHAAQERNESQWKELLEKSGLKLIKFWIPSSGGEGIVEVELK